MKCSTIKPSDFDFVKHWSIKDKEKMVGICFNISKRYPSLEFDEKKSIIYELLWKTYLEKKEELLPNNNIAGKIRVYLYREVKKSYFRVNTYINYSAIYQSRFIDEDYEKKIDYLSAEKILAQLLKQELSYIEKNKENIIEKLEFCSSNSDKSHWQKFYRLKKKAKEYHEQAEIA